jgi:c-di-GMP phosphodiesterase
MSGPYFFFRPLLAPNRAWTALEWNIGDQPAADANDYARCFTESGAAPLSDKLPLVLATDPVWLLLDEFVQQFTAHQAIFALPAASLDDQELLDRCLTLRKQGRHLALGIDNAATINRVPVAAFDYLHVDAALARYELTALELSYTASVGLRRIATGVASHNLFDWLAAKRVELSDSRFLSVSDPSTPSEPDLTRLKLLRLLSLVTQDADTREIEEIFREEPKLSYNLLRLVNSVAVGARTTISSFHQAIALLGRRQLQRWLQLLIYANQLAHANDPNPLLQLAAARGRQMECLAAVIEPPPELPQFADAAFMTGIFSLLDVLLNLPMRTILDALPLQDDIAAALAGRRGLLGEMLAAVVAGEAGDYAAAEERLVHLKISPEQHAAAQTTAFLWASRITLE